jgi:hypothetical protein
MSLASARLECSLLSMVSVTDESELPLAVTWVSPGSDEAIEVTSRPQMLVELASESESSVSEWVAQDSKLRREPLGDTRPQRSFSKRCGIN